MSQIESHANLVLSPRFTAAVDYAREIHTGTRKGTPIPYMAHLLGVASLVLGEVGHVKFSVTEDMVIAALLHDAVEDAGGMPRLRDIEDKFGPAVAEIVAGCTDSFDEDGSNKQRWEDRKAAYVDRLATGEESDGTLLVSVADKVYNARAIVEDYRQIGPEVWKRFRRGRDKQLWYYDQLWKIYDRRCPDWRITAEFKRVVHELRDISGDEVTQ